MQLKPDIQYVYLHLIVCIILILFYSRRLIETGVYSSRGVYLFILRVRRLGDANMKELWKDSVVRSHHVYKSVWTPVIGEKLYIP